MSTVAEFKSAAAKLSAQDRWELQRWLGESADVQRLRHAELRREIAIGLEQADRGEMAQLEVTAIKGEIRRRLSGKTN